MQSGLSCRYVLSVRWTLCRMAYESGRRMYEQYIRCFSFSRSGKLQGDHSRCYQPPVDTDLVHDLHSKAQLLFLCQQEVGNYMNGHPVEGQVECYTIDPWNVQTRSSPLSLFLLLVVKVWPVKRLRDGWELGIFLWCVPHVVSRFPCRCSFWGSHPCTWGQHTFCR